MAGPAGCSRRLLLIAGLLAVAAVPLACVDSVSQGDFRARADARCREFREQSDGLLDAQPGTGAPAARSLRRLRVLMLRTAAQLRALEPPLGDADQIARYIAGVEINAEYVRRLAVAVQQRRRARIEELRDRLFEGTANTGALAAAYGFEVCGAA